MAFLAPLHVLLVTADSAQIIHLVLGDYNKIFHQHSSFGDAGKVFECFLLTVSNTETLSIFFFPPASGGWEEWVPPICCSCKGPWGESCILPHSLNWKEARKKEKKRSCQANRYSLPCLLHLVASAHSQGLQSQRVKFPWVYGEQSDSERCHMAPVP